MGLGEYIARGREAEVFAWDDGNHPAKVLKLFYPGVDSRKADHELAITRAASSAGAPAPAVYGDVVSVDGRYGIVCERMFGPDMLKVLSARTWRILLLARTTARLHAGMHRARPSGIRNLNEMLADRIARAKPLSPREKEAATSLLESLPGGEALCHGDFHPGNIIMRDESEGGPVVIDWTNAAAGDPLADVARSQLLMSIGWRALPNARDRFIARWMSALFKRAYTGEYFRLTDADPSDTERWRTVVAAARLGEEIPEETAHVLKLVRAGLSQA